MPRDHKHQKTARADFNLAGPTRRGLRHSLARHWPRTQASPTALSGLRWIWATSRAPLVIHGDQDPYASRHSGLSMMRWEWRLRIGRRDGSDHAAHALTQPKVQWAGAIGPSSTRAVASTWWSRRWRSRAPGALDATPGPPPRTPSRQSTPASLRDIITISRRRLRPDASRPYTRRFRPLQFPLIRGHRPSPTGPSRGSGNVMHASTESSLRCGNGPGVRKPGG